MTKKKNLPQDRQEGHKNCDSHWDDAPLLALREFYSLRCFNHRAEKSATLTIKALCRRLCGGDKSAGSDLYDRIRGKGAPDGLAPGIERDAWMHCEPLLSMRSAMAIRRKEAEKQMVKLAKQLPCADWIVSVRGAGLLNFALILAETGDLSNYPNPRHLWKRMGLAVNADGRAQRKIVGADGAAQGYSPRRRSVMFNVGECFKKVGGDYRLLYLQEKARLIKDRPDWQLIRCDKTALRIVEKTFLVDLWQHWNGKQEGKGLAGRLPRDVRHTRIEPASPSSYDKFNAAIERAFEPLINAGELTISIPAAPDAPRP